MNPLLKPYAKALASGPVMNRRACERRNMIKRLRSGRLGDMTQRDLQMLRQASFIHRNGRRFYDSLHTYKAGEEWT